MSARYSRYTKNKKVGIRLHGHSLQMLAGFISSLVFISSNFPMLYKALRTKDMHSYSLGQLTLGNVGNTVYWLYVASLPVGPVWFLQGFFSLSSASMLFCYLRYEKKWFQPKALNSPALGVGTSSNADLPLTNKGQQNA